MSHFHGPKKAKKKVSHFHGIKKIVAKKVESKAQLY